MSRGTPVHAPATGVAQPKRQEPFLGSGGAPPWAWGAGLAVVLAVVYLVLRPPSADLAAATYRANLFARAGFALWDDGWYAGHALPAYSLLAPALGAWLGVRLLLAISAIAAAALFGLLAPRWLARRAAVAATLCFSFGFCAELPSGRVPYDLGAAVALAALLALASRPRHRRAAALGTAATVALAIATAAASPVAGAFLALAGSAIALAVHGSRRGQDGCAAARLAGLQAARGLLAALAALATILVLALMFPEGGYEPFAAGAFWPELGAAIAVAALLPGDGLGRRAHRTLRIGAWLYTVALAGSFLVRTPMGGNVVRLGAMLGAPVLLGALWQAGGVRIGRRRVAGGALLLAISPLLLYWQLATSIDDQVALAGDRTVQASFYAPLRRQLLRISGSAGGRAGGHPIRVEVPLTGAHWESAYLPGGPISLARGWERQLDTLYGAPFYGRLTSAVYQRWLHTYAIAYVALPKARLDSAGEQEARLIESRPSYLQEVWRSRDWRLFEVSDATPLVQAPARMLSVGVDSFAFLAPKPGDYEVRLHWSPYWMPARPRRSGRACVARAPDGFTEVRVSHAGVARVSISFALGRVFAEGPRCAH